MKNHLRRTLLILIAAVVGILGFAAIACDSELPDEPPATPIVYYAELAGTEYKLTVTGAEFSLEYGSTVRGGSYAASGSSVTLAFTGGGSASGTDEGNVISVTLDGNAMKFYKDVKYTVKFDSGNGSAVADQTVRNGSRATKPADPTRAEHTFIGWYTDNTYKTPYDFATRLVTGDVTVYAQWAPLPGEIEFTVDFDLNYDGAPELESKTTILGKVYAAPVPARDGYEFKGWWVSMPGNADELSYMLKDSTVLYENTTVYALWQGPAGDKLPSPIVDVSDEGISWQAVGMTANGYDINITGPNGYVFNKSETTGTSTAVDFTQLPAGDYTISVVARSTAGADKYSEPTVRVYRNKALARVSLFDVLNEQVLTYNEVSDAVSYKIYIDCADDNHHHSPIDNEGHITYDFGNCAMPEDGINFYVVAEAEGYAPSTSAVYNYNRMLDEIPQAGLKYDATTETVSWNAVEKAVGYEVKVGDSAANTVYDTKLDIRTQAAGSIKITVRPVAFGYNSNATELTVNKTTLATPSNVRMEGNIVKWDAVDGADKYTVAIAGKSMDVASGTQLDLTSADIDWNGTTDYSLTVKAEGGGKASLASEALAVMYNKMSAELEYENGVVTWQYVFGATGYDVRVNEGEPERVTGVNSAAVAFTKDGVNKIEVRFVNGNTASEWVSLDVTAYALNYDLNGANGELATQYYAEGDEISLYAGSDIQNELIGHKFVGWYTSVEVNGMHYTNEVYNLNKNLTLYANWTARTYTVTLDYNVQGSGPVTSIDVVYGEQFKIDPPTDIPDGAYGFVGWYRGTDSASLQYTDASGNSVIAWNEPGNLTLYAQYRSVLAYEKQADGTYWVMAGTYSRNVDVLTIPATYKGPDDATPHLVSTIGETTFNSCRNLTTVRIPNTIKDIDISAFKTNMTLKTIEVYDAGANDPVYRSENGVLFYNNNATGGVDVWAYPRAKDDEVYELPGFVTNIPIRAFWYSQFKEVVIPTNVTTVMGTAFYKTDKLETVTFKPDSSFTPVGDKTKPDTLIIAAGAFGESPNITEITLPARFADKEDGTFNTDIFYHLYVLDTVKLDPDSKYKLTNNGMVYLPGSGGSGNKLVYCPAGMAGTATIADNISVVGKHAFSGQRGLTTIVIPGNVTTLEAQSFSGYRIYPEGTSSSLTYADINGALVKTVRFGGDRLIGLVIGDAAFGYSHDGNKLAAYTNCRDLDKLVFDEGSNVVEIGDWAFAGTSLVNVVIPNSVERIGSYAFYHILELTSFGFEESETVDENKKLMIGDGIFNDCSILTSLTLPYYFSLEGNSGLFAGCINLKNVYVDKNNPYLTSDDGVLFDKNIETIFFYPLARQGVYELPESVKTIGAGVFAGKTNITGIIIHNNVTTINAQAFENCIELGSVEFRGTWTEELTIESGAFKGCIRLQNVTFPEMLTEISESLFVGCTRLESVNIPSTVTSIGKEAFKGCSMFKGKQNENGTWELLIPKSVVDLGYGAFYDCTSITKVTFEDDRTQVLNVLGTKGTAITNGDSGTETYSSTFYNCVSIESLTLVEKISAIGGQMFCNCAKITEVHIPASVRYIGAQAFYKSPLTSLTFAERPVENPTQLILGGGATNNNSPFYGIKVTELVFPNGLTRIPRYAFYDIKTLEYVYIPNTVCNGGSSSFSDGYGGTTYDYGEAIGYAAFSSCSNLSRVEFQDGGSKPFSLGQSAFSYGALTSVKLPSRIVPFTFDGKTRHVIDTAFFSQKTLSAVDVFAGGDYSSYDGMLLQVNDTGYTIVYCPLGKSGEVTLPYTVTAVGNKSFTDNNGITKLSFQDTPEGEDERLLVLGSEQVDHTATGSTLGIDAAFYNMRALTEVNFPKRLSAVNEYAFYNSRLLKTITFADGCEVDSLGAYSFLQCEKLVTVDFGENCKLKTIGSNAFSKCSALSAITIPDSVTEIQASAFEGLDRLRTVSISENSSLAEIGNNAFGQTAISTIYIPDGFAPDGFGDNVFMSCISLTSVSIPNTVSSVNGLFTGCIRLNNIIIRPVDANAAISGENGLLYTITDTDKTLVYAAPTYKGDEDGLCLIQDGVTGIAASAFANNPYIKEVRIPTSVRTIGDSAFKSCSNLAKVSFYDTADVDDVAQTLTVGNYAFDGDVELASISFPRALSSIGDYAFQNTNKLKSSTVGETKTDAVVFADNCLLTTIGKYAFYQSAIDSIQLPSMLRKIDDYAFRYSKLTSITIPNTVTEIGTAGDKGLVNSYVFANCDNLTSVTFAGGGTQDLDIQNYAFYQCKALSSITLCLRIKTIPLYFANETAITELNIPKSVETISQYAFKACAKLTTVTFDAESKCVTIAGDVFSDCKLLDSITLPDSLVTLNAALKNTAVKTLTIPGAVTTLTAGFLTGTPIQTVVFADGNRSALALAASLFKDLKTLTSVTLPNDLVTINASVFSGSGITSITIPQSVKKVGVNVFQNCASLTEVVFEDQTTLTIANGTNNGWQSGTASGTPTNAGIFQGCNLLQRVVLPAGIKYLGVNIFQNLPALEEVVLQSGLEEISNNAFYGSSIKRITIPNTVTSINANAFRDCANLTTVTFESGNSGTELKTGVNAFYNSGLTSVALPARLTTIGGSTFADCADLTTVTFDTGSMLTTIENNVFWGTGISTITLPDSLLKMGNYVFRESALTAINIPKSVTSMGTNPFRGCENLATITVDAANETYTAENNVLYSKDKTMLYAVAPAGIPAAYTVAESVVEIAAEAFAYAPVTSLTVGSNVVIGQRAFYYCDKLESVNGATNVVVDYQAFVGCEKLAAVNLGASAELSNQAFYDCDELVTVTLGAGATLGSRVFENCDALLTVTATDVVSVGTELFKDCEHDVTFSGAENAVTRYKGYDLVEREDGWYVYVDKDFTASTFNGDIVVEHVIIGKDVTNIPASAFEGCTGLVSFEMEEGGESEITIGSRAFANCTKLAKIHFSKNVVRINSAILVGSVAVSEVTTPFVGALRAINTTFENGEGKATHMAFWWDTYLSNGVPAPIKKVTVTDSTHMPYGSLPIEALEEVWLPDTLTDIGVSLSASSGGLFGTKGIHVKKVHFGNSLKAIPNYMFTKCAELEEINIPVSVASIGGTSVFSDAKKLAKIYYEGTISEWAKITFASSTGGTPLGNGGTLYIDDEPVSGDLVISETANVTAIAPYTFYNMKNVTSITIPSTVTSYGNYAFANCVDLETVVLGTPNSAPTTGTYLFSGDVKLASVTLPENLTTTGNYMFSGCSALTEIDLPETLTSVGQYMFTKTGFTEFDIPSGIKIINTGMFDACPNLAAVTIPDGVTTINAYAFRNCPKLDNVVIPDSVTSMMTYIFQNDSALSNVTLSAGLTSIGNYAFQNCTALTQIELPESLTSIGTYLFAATGLTSIVIPENLSTISNYAFQNCKSLQSVTFSGNLTSIGAFAFSGCSALQTVSVPFSVAMLGNNAFADCTSLTSVEFEYDLDGNAGITTFGNNVFLNCSKLASIVIPSSLMTVGTGCFNGWTAEQTIYMEGFGGPMPNWDANWKGTCNADVVWDYDASAVPEPEPEPEPEPGPEPELEPEA